MAQQPYASDWTTIRDGLQYSKQTQLYWFKGRVYDERSAQHNGIIGAGANLHQILRHLKETT